MTVMTAGPTWASSLQILVVLFGIAVFIQDSIGGDVLGSYLATSVSKTSVAPEFVSNSMNHRRFKFRAKRFTSRRVLHTVNYRNKQLQSGKGCASVRGSGHKSLPEREKVEVEIPMQ